jgi:hypothetical protein
MPWSFRVAALCVAAALWLTACEASAQAIPDDFRITLDRRACFGECPVYTVSIDAPGTVIYEGDRFVRVVGRQTDRIPPARVAELVAAAERIGFFELRDQYLTIRNPDGTEFSITDGPTTFVTLTRDGRTKRIEHYLGAPAGLRALERQIDEIAGTIRWVRVDESTVRQMVAHGRPPSEEERAGMLRKAIQYDDVEVIEALLEIGADPNAPYHTTNTTLLMMVRSGAAARALLDAGADPFASNDHRMTPLAWATQWEPGVTEALLEAGVPADHGAAAGQTALLSAACNGNAAVVALLLQAGANPDGTADGRSPVDCARRARASEIARPDPVIPGWQRPFVTDFDGVIALLEDAIAARPPQR